MMDTIEIHKVKNGYVAHPPFDPAYLPPAHFNNMHVFETFDGLVAWLRERFEGEHGPTSACSGRTDGRS